MTVSSAFGGRGAADMKEMTAITRAAVHSLLSDPNFALRRTLKLIFFSDEENGGSEGSDWLVREHPEIFDGVGMVVSETGEFGEVVHDASALDSAKKSHRVSSSKLEKNQRSGTALPLVVCNLMDLRFPIPTPPQL